MQTRLFDAVVFSTRAAVAAVVAYVGYNLLKLPGASWAAVSAVIVSQPSLHPSMRASLLRVEANLIGAASGAIMSTLVGHNLVALGIGVFSTGIICAYTRLEEAVRSAYAAVVIVMLTGTDQDKWHGPLERVFAVMFGCAATLAVSLIFDLVGRLFQRNPEQREHKASPGDPGE
jgi:uncharacterized membrane protein YgaE (UPF0421/DUF939 family)